MTTSNKTLVYKKHPTGMPVVGEHLVIEDRPIDIESPPPSGGLVFEILFSSLDPYMRGRMRDDSTSKSYIPAFQIDGPVTAGCVAKILLSGDEAAFPVGSHVVAMLPIAEYARLDDARQGLTKPIVNPHNLPLDLFIGAMGMPGLTAWAGLHRIGQPKAGETIFISSAAGAVGQIVGQIAKREGLTVIGSVGSDEKLEFITKELGFDSGFNYKSESPFTALPRLAPKGIDIYFENVGGDHLEAAIQNMNDHGRIPVCGMISNYNTPAEEQPAIRGLTNLIWKQIRMEGFIQSNPLYGPAYTKEHQEKLGQWLAEGSVKAKQHVTEGIENAGEALVGMLQGKNFGKAVLKIR
jgi:NADPH-dependent curcumin reductase CurA